MNPSVVAKTFGLSGDDAAPFAAKWIPKKWKPRIVSNGLWDEDNSGDVHYGFHGRLIRLEAFPSAHKSIRDDVLRWLSSQLKGRSRIIV